MVLPVALYWTSYLAIHLFETIQVDELTAGYKFERQLLLSTLKQSAQNIRCRYYRQKKDVPLPPPLNLFATDFIPLPKDFYLSPALLQYLSENGGNVVFIPENTQFKAWDFVHYSSSSSSSNSGSTKEKTIITFVSTTISEGRPTETGLWTVDFHHENVMKQSMNKGDVVDRTLSSLGIYGSKSFLMMKRRKFLSPRWTVNLSLLKWSLCWSPLHAILQPHRHHHH